MLLVPNAALRFAPEAPAAAASQAGGGIVSKLMPRARPQVPRKARTTTAAAREVWVLQDGAPFAVAVVPGVSDGRLTEITGGALQPGMAVITGQASGSSQ